MSVKYIIGNAALDKAIATFAKRAATMHQMMGQIALSVLKHAIDHGDIRLMAKFVSAMPKSQRVNALVAWFEHFGPVTFDAQKVPSHVKAKKATSDLAGAEAKPFWEFVPEPEVKAIDIVKLIESTIKKLQKDAEAHGTCHDPLIGVLKGQLSSYAAQPTVQ